ncbi:MAG: hypothetical protein ACLTMP_09045 [Eggerthella lenta]
MNVDDKTARALRQAAAQIRDFHERQKQQSWFAVREDGARGLKASRWNRGLRAGGRAVPVVGADERAAGRRGRRRPSYAWRRRRPTER